MAIQLKKIYQNFSSQYFLSIKGGNNGLINTVRWVYMLEDFSIVSRFHGSELAVTTAMKGNEDGWLLELVKLLCEHHASGLIINTGMYVQSVPQDVLDFCNKNDFPIITAPWKVFITEMVEAFCMEIINERAESIMHDHAIIDAINGRENITEYTDTLSRFYHMDKNFQIIVIYIKKLDDTQNRTFLMYWLESQLRKAKFGIHSIRIGLVAYENKDIVIINNTTPEFSQKVINIILDVYNEFVKSNSLAIGIGITAENILQIKRSYRRAITALRMALYQGTSQISYDDMGIYQILFSVEDTEILVNYANRILAPVDAYDKKHHSNYIELLRTYIKCDKSLILTSESMFMHRNTVNYQIQKIKELLNNDLKDPDYIYCIETALLIRRIQESRDTQGLNK